MHLKTLRVADAITCEKGKVMTTVIIIVPDREYIFKYKMHTMWSKVNENVMCSWPYSISLLLMFATAMSITEVLCHMHCIVHSACMHC